MISTMRNHLYLFIVLTNLMTGPARAADPEVYPDGNQILEKIDKNLTSETRVSQTRMIIHDRRNTRVVTSKSWAMGKRTAFTEYLDPPRERGTKMLILENRLWTYSPSTDRTIQIAGYLLRQSVMGSDLSYEDVMENPRLQEVYEATVTGTETIDGQRCWKIDLEAVVEGLAYQSRKLWVDQERGIPLREERFARGGTLLKRVDLTDLRQIGARWFPTHAIYKDVLRAGSGTEFITDEILFDVRIPAHVFTKASLRR